MGLDSIVRASRTYYCSPDTWSVSLYSAIVENNHSILAVLLDKTGVVRDGSPTHQPHPPYTSFSRYAVLITTNSDGCTLRADFSVGFSVVRYAVCPGTPEVTLCLCLAGATVVRLVTTRAVMVLFVKRR